MKGKRITAVLLGAVLAVTAAMTSWALPAGLSVIDGRTVRCGMAGFEVTFPEGYEVVRYGDGMGLNYLSYMEEDGVKLDFAAAAVSEEQKSFIMTAGLVFEGSKEELGLDELKQALAEDPSYLSFVSIGTAAIAGSGYETVKINYGAMWAQYMESWMNGYDMTPEERQEYNSYVQEMADSVYIDLYIRPAGGNYYILTQVYSGSQAGSAAGILGQMHPYAGDGWNYTEENGWHYIRADGAYAVNQWAQDENGLTYRLDGSGQIMYKAWIDEGGRWKYVDEFGHMVTNITKTIDGIQYTFDAQGYMAEGCERNAAVYETGTVSGQTYSNRWADLFMRFPDTAELIPGDGSYYSYPLEAGENMYYWYEGGSGYLLTLDYTDSEQQLDRYLEWLIEYAAYYDYKVDSTGTVNMGGYDYKVVRTSCVGSDGITEHEDTYFRQIDGKRVEISIEYTGDRQATVDQILAAIERIG